MQFYIASLAIFYHFPCIMFQLINTDMISLSDSLKDGNLLAENFVRNFFNYKVNTKTSMRVKVLGNHLIKVSVKSAQSSNNGIRTNYNALGPASLMFALNKYLFIRKT